jgi:hypothetical protein
MSAAADDGDRRRPADRRRLTWRSLLQGGLTPRRRVGRREADHSGVIDWHSPHLLFLAMVILLLSVADAFLTLTLLEHGAHEANPLLAFVLEQHPKAFAVVKMALTGGGILVLVALARARLFRVMRVAGVLHGIALGYTALIVYEWWLLRALM